MWWRVLGELGKLFGMPSMSIKFCGWDIDSRLDNSSLKLRNDLSSNWLMSGFAGEHGGSDNDLGVVSEV